MLMISTYKTLVTAIALVIAGTASAKDTVTIATDATFPPFESVDASGNLVGYDIELAEAICNEAKLKCDIIGAAWEGMIPGLISKKYDALISQLTVTEARRKVMAFSDIYQLPTFRFVAHKGAGLTISPEGLKGKTIAVQTGTPMDAYITKTFPGATIKRYASGSEPYLELAAGRADTVLNYEAQIVYSFLNQKEGENFELIGSGMTGKDAPEFGEGVAMAINKSNKGLLEQINAGLKAVRDSGQLDKLNTKYFGQ
jgi:arginine/ornithine transport system substrate-binding protein